MFSIFQKIHFFGISATFRMSWERVFVSPMWDFLFLLYFFSINDANRTNQEILCLPYAYLTHRCSQAVLQTVLLFIDSFIEWVPLYETVYKTTSPLHFSLSFLSYKI